MCFRVGMVMESERSVKEWIKLLKEYPDPHVRRKAAEALGKLRDPKAVKPLISALERDQEGSVRCAAAQALGELGDRKAVKPLIKALGLKSTLSSKRKRVRGVVEIVDLKIQGEISSEVISNAATALGRIGDPRAIKPLGQTLRRHKEYARIRAALALGMFEDQHALSFLVDSVERDPSIDVRRSAAQALRGRIGWLDPARRTRIQLTISSLLGEPTVIEGPSREVFPGVEVSDGFLVVPSTSSEAPARVFCRFCGERISIEEETCPKCKSTQ